MGGLASNTEILFASLVVSSLALALAQGPLWPRLLGMGLLMGSALLIKQVVAPEGCLAYALFAWPLLRQRRWRMLLATALAYAALCLMPTLLIGGIYALRGEFDIWFESTVLAPLEYASGRIPLEQMFWRITLAALAFRWLMVLALPALVLPWSDPLLRRLTFFALGWFAVACLAVAGPGFFFPHYFLILLPPLSLPAAIGV
ncbi:MAG: hypothetical protein WCP77_21050, partial [Roseococcus sp.]